MGSYNDGLIESLDEGEELPSVESQYPLLCDKSALSIFRLFFVQQLIGFERLDFKITTSD